MGTLLSLVPEDEKHGRKMMKSTCKIWTEELDQELCDAIFDRDTKTGVGQGKSFSCWSIIPCQSVLEIF